MLINNLSLKAGNNNIYIHQIKETGARTKFSVVGCNLDVAYKEIKLFKLL